MERPHATFYLVAITMFALSVIIYEKFAIEMCMTFTLISRTGQYHINI